MLLAADSVKSSCSQSAPKMVTRSSSLGCIAETTSFESLAAVYSQHCQAASATTINFASLAEWAFVPKELGHCLLVY